MDEIEDALSALLGEIYEHGDRITDPLLAARIKRVTE